MQVQQQFEYIFTSVIFLSFCLVSFHYFCGCVFQKNGEASESFVTYLSF